MTHNITPMIIPSFCRSLFSLLIFFITFISIEILSFFIIVIKPIFYNNSNFIDSFKYAINQHPYFASTILEGGRVMEYKIPTSSIFSPINQFSFTINNEYAGLKTGEIGQILNSKNANMFLFKKN